MKVKSISIPEALAAATETKLLKIARDILGDVPKFFRELFPEDEAIIVADPHTYAAAGKKVQEALQKAGIPSKDPIIIDDPELFAEMSFVDQVEAGLRGHKAIPIAVGSGTINDITKLAAHRVNRRYLCVATAASMDGYAAYGSSITYQGSKQTFNCPAPFGVVADLNVFSAAPKEMCGWGFGDMAAKVTAGADWILADALGVEPIEEQAWNIAQGSISKALGDPKGVHDGDPEAMGSLVEALMLGGFAMQYHRTSRPASGAEHQFSHLWDMQHHTYNGQTISHGAKVGIGTLAITALYETMFSLDPAQIDIDAAVANWPSLDEWLERARQRFTIPELQAVALREMEAKHVSKEEIRREVTRLKENWQKIKESVQAQLFSYEDIHQRLQDVGGPHEPEQIGISRERLREAYTSAFYIRRRYTVLDVAVRANILETCLNKIFGSQGRWPI